MNEKNSYDVRNRDNTTISYHSEVQRREHSADTAVIADTAESMDRKKSNKKQYKGVTTDFFGEAKPMGGHNLPPLVEIGLMYLKI